MDAELVDGWIRYYEVGDPNAEWVNERFYDLIQTDPELAWECIVEVSRLTRDENVLANLAAGPLEDLLVYHGTKFIERVELCARQLPAFTLAVKGVWQNTIEPAVWERVHALQKKYS